MTRTFAILVTVGALLPATAAAQSQDRAPAGQALSRVLSSEIAISRDRAEIQLELANGRKISAATVVDERTRFEREVTESGDQMLTLRVRRGGAVDRSWREVLNRAIEAPADQLATLLRDWESPREFDGDAFDAALAEALSGASGVPVAAGAPAAPVAPGVIDDSVIKLESRIQQLQAELHEREAERKRGPDWFAPFRRLWIGLSGIFSLFIFCVVLFGIGFVTILFGGRRYIEGVADTARAGIGRSFLVGLAGMFLLIPVFVLGCIALAISIVGIPALLVWIPLFPLGTVAAVLLGFLGVAHAAGESWAERNYYGSDWFRRGNSYYFMMTGLLLLASLLFASRVLFMAGPWLDFFTHLLVFFGAVLMWGAATIGFGAVLISRGGSRPANAAADQGSLFTEEANV
jgi:hypothetical protein